MSGYRTLHRIQPSESSPTDPPPTLWHVHFSPCRPDTPTPSLRLLASGASRILRAYSLRERTKNDAATNDALDASPMVVTCTDCLVPADFSDETASSRCALGYGALDIARNYCGADLQAGNEVVVASQLGGKVGVWVRLDPMLRGKKVDVDETGIDQNLPRYIRPDAEFSVASATGTTLAIRPPTLGNYYSQRESDILVALGSANGSVILCRTGVVAARPGQATKTGASGGVVGDSSSTRVEQTINVKSNSTPGQVVATVGGGHACVLSIAWHPTIPNTFAVGRKDGTIDVYSSTASERYDEELSFRRMHRLVDSSCPIRGLTFSQPEGALLFAGDDSGKLYSYDVSVGSSSFASYGDAVKAAMSPIKLVACALTAHKGWIMNLCAFPDERRVCSCGSDRSVKVWDCGMGLASSTPVHSFDGVHSGWVWDVSCGSVVGLSAGGGSTSSSGKKITLVSCGNDGVMQVFSCGD
ncbi:hypothetical protein ACHAW6_007281 [Cyclotella cf. meneghiniana]